MTGRFPVADLIGGRVRGLAEYAPEPLSAVAQRLGMPEDRLIKLDANENPYGPTPQAMEALRRFDGYHRYPDAISRDLRAALGEHLGVDPEHILVGNGSDELIDLILTVFRPGPDGGGIGELINCPPTFGMYQFYAVTNDLVVFDVPRLADFAVDVEAIEDLVCEDERPRILFLASPNNPDGQSLLEEALRRLLTLPLLVVLDEAYVDFGGESRAALVSECDNLIVLRTFSKWAGLAGLRVGYGVFPAALMPALWRLKSPYNVNVAAQVAALATLRSLARAEAAVERIVAERERVRRELGALPRLHALPSEANYLLVDVGALGVNRVREAMEARGIILRYFGAPDLARYVRITVGTPEQNDAVLEVLRSLDREVQDGR